jgi:hypothetical protein
MRGLIRSDFREGFFLSRGASPKTSEGAMSRIANNNHVQLRRAGLENGDGGRSFIVLIS